MTDYSAYQKGVIKRFYDNRDAIALQKLAEMVSDLYVETSAAKLKRTWARVEKQMVAAGAHPHQAKSIVDDQDLGTLAKIIGELT